MTSFSMTCRQAGTVSTAASREPARPAGATAVLPSIPVSSGVFRA
jgi:hypothetical protein